MGRTRDAFIQSEIADRDIRYLLHFTQATNLPSILQHGILSREEIIARGLTAHVSDHERLDEDNGAISVSFTTFNYWMWHAKRAKNPGATWIFLLLDPNLMWRRECRFYDANPATSYIKKSWRQFGSTSAFEEIFKDACPFGMHRGGSYRDHHGIPSHWPTNPDSEIQVLEPIPPEFILHAWVETAEISRQVQALFDQSTDRERKVCVGSFDQPLSLDTAPIGRQSWGFPNKTEPRIYPELFVKDPAATPAA